MLAVLDARQLHFAVGVPNGGDMDVHAFELLVNLDGLTRLQASLLRDIKETFHTGSMGSMDAAAEKCAVDSYRARTPAGPSGELAAVYRAIGRALAERDGASQPAVDSSLIVESRVVSADPENTSAGTIERYTPGKEATVRWDDGTTTRLVVVEDLRPEGV